MINTNNMTVQQVIDAVAEKLIGQGEQCLHRGTCAYSDGEGNHCAIGWLLDKDSPAMDFEGGVHSLSLHFSPSDLGVNGSFIINNDYLLGDIQVLHDADIVDLLTRLESVENQYKQYDFKAWHKWLELRLKQDGGS